jgi:PIN domain nuclease of toxin-antitoxin system
MKLLLDTCAIIWIVSGAKELSKHARTLIEGPGGEVYYCPISCAEVSWAAERKRITIDRHWKLWFRHYVDLNGWEGVPIDLDIVEEAYSLPEPFHADPVDRLIVATARIHDLTVVTGDRRILDYPHIRTIG